MTYINISGVEPDQLISTGIPSVTFFRLSVGVVSFSFARHPWARSDVKTRKRVARDPPRHEGRRADEPSAVDLFHIVRRVGG